MKRIGIILLLILFSCSDREPIEILPEIALVSHIFDTTQDIDVRVSLSENETFDETNYLVRWDWESDGLFDTNYSSGFSAKHRYHEPGEYIITVEVIALDEKTTQTSTKIIVEQGFSRPVPNFTIAPKTGNIKTNFHFDASLSFDSEEENELLIYSWDFDGDNQFEFSSTGNSIANHAFADSGEYNIRLVVTDTTGLSSELVRMLSVTMIDTLIVPIISYAPQNPTDRDTIYFDASESYYFDSPETLLTYQFKQANGAWTERSDISEFAWTRPLTGISSLKVRVFGPGGFYNETDINFQVTMGDTPPTAFFHRSSRFGNITTNFYFDAWGSSDKEDMPSILRVKWDFDGDGSWDTPFSEEKYIYWRFSQSGTYLTKMRVIDSSGGTDDFEQEIRVSQFNNPTGFVFDDRGSNYYGTVMLGSRWWMSENLRFNPNNDAIPGHFLTWCYNDNQQACDATGKLYHAQTILSSWNGKWPNDNICPKGWRVPSAQEWVDLINLYGFNYAGTALFYSGESDFNALYGGYAGNHIYGGFVDFEMDSIYKTAVFMSSDIISGKLRTFQLKRDSTNAEERRMVTDGYYSIRCIKDQN